MACFWSVIPAGGAGTRLWPLSRAHRPKFLLPLTGERSLLQQTVDRLGPLSAPEQTYVVCGTAHAAAIGRQVPAVPEQNIVVEPSPKGSGPAIGLAAALIARRDPNAVMGSFAADHDVRNEEAFRQAITVAIDAAADGWLVTIGLSPSRPETGYGYIERTDEVVARLPEGVAYRAKRFVEKPDHERAVEFVASGRYDWNASMFIWRAQTLLDELRSLQPELLAGLNEIVDAWGTSDQEHVLAEVWARLPEVTIDHGVMERASRVAVVPAEMGWSDVGDWHGLGSLLDLDKDNNSGKGERLSVDSHDNVIWSSTGKMVALVGVEHTVVIDTPDALLIASRSNAQEVRHVVARLKDGGRSELT